MAVLRFTGGITPKARAEHQRVLDAALKANGLAADRPPVFIGYDPPFSIPFPRRNEVAVPLG